MSPSLRRNKAHAVPTLLRGHNGSMTFLEFISDDQIISASEDRTIRRWHLSDGHNTAVKEMMVCALAVSPNRRWVAVGGRDGRVRLLDLETPLAEVLKSVAKHEDVVKSLSFSPDSSRLASGAQDGAMLVWSSATLEQVAGPFKGHTDAVWWLCYSPDGRKIASCDREVVQVRDTATWTTLVINEKAWSLAWAHKGRTLLAGCIDGTIRIYNPTTGVLHATCSGHKDVVFSIALSHSAKFFATASWDKTICLWEANTFQQIGPSLQHDAKIHSLSISPDDSHLVSGARDSNIRVWNLRTIASNLFKDFPLEPNRGPVCLPYSSTCHILSLTLLYSRRMMLLSSCFPAGVYILPGALVLLMYLQPASLQGVMLIPLCYIQGSDHEGSRTPVGTPFAVVSGSYSSSSFSIAKHMSIVIVVLPRAKFP